MADDNVKFKGLVFDHDCHPLVTGIFDVPKTVIKPFNDVESSHFFRYVNEQKLTGKFTSLEQSTKDYIIEYNIGYIIVEEGDGAKLPEYLNAYKDTVLEFDGNSFIKLLPLK